MLRTEDSQSVLPVGTTACAVCPYALLKLCEGPTTRGSFLVPDDSIVGCFDGERLWKYYRDLHKSYYPQPRSSNQTELHLPKFISLVAESKLNLDDVSSGRLLGISLEDILNDSGRVAFKSAAHLRQRLKLSPNAQLALIGTGMDWKLERFWKVSDLEDSFRRIADLEFEFVTTCTFSIWSEHPRFDQIYNRERNMFTYDMFSSMGVPSIPFMLFSKSDLDYRQNIEWLKARDDITVVAMLGQTGRRVSDFVVLLNEMDTISKEIDRQVHFLVVGPSELDRITSVAGRFCATIATSKPFQAALHGEQADSALDFEKNIVESRETLFKSNVEEFEKHCGYLCTCVKAQHRELSHETPLDFFADGGSPDHVLI